MPRFTVAIESASFGCKGYKEYYWVIYKHNDVDGKMDHFGIKFAYGKVFHPTAQEAEDEFKEFLHNMSNLKVIEDDD